MSEFNRLKLLAKLTNTKQFGIGHCQKLELLVDLLSDAESVNHFSSENTELKLPTCPLSFLAQIHSASDYLNNFELDGYDDYQRVWIAVSIVNNLVEGEDDCDTAYTSFMDGEYLHLTSTGVNHPYVGLGRWFVKEYPVIYGTQIWCYHAEAAKKAGFNTATTQAIEDAIRIIVTKSLDLEQYIFFGIGYPDLPFWYRCLSQSFANSAEVSDYYSGYVKKVLRQLRREFV
ncbi:hypothetical protein [Teredinibacter sp. KSP-S5-2]|uniref:hypothetical protein n=1 Tax=Teredinibacter sp. KSP-S5-2 TaxID=3034506 RepID=UPI0029348A23|nr:hypothetical protein [Teredinibacter sp. KSP-S5-2]WNO08880.1 hypothetical protein P5V12_18070 [Teredinibacter sp. KSP-S5-2]